MSSRVDEASTAEGHARQAGIDAARSSGGWPAALGLRRSRRRKRPLNVHRPIADPVLIEEQAAALLYGERTGTVVASPAQPPVA